MWRFPLSLVTAALALAHGVTFTSGTALSGAASNVVAADGTIMMRRESSASAARASTPDATRARAAKYGIGKNTAPCKCEAANAAWKVPTRTTPKCLFVDLGANDGETYRAFLGKSAKWKFDYDTGGFKNKAQCGAILVEANPKFKPDLDAFTTASGDAVEVMSSTAVYMCDKEGEKFNLDVGNANGWGSSLNGTHESVAHTKKEVEVTLVNLMRVLTEHAIPEDTVVVKMDIEGAEWDILPCLAASESVLKLIDTLYFENHCAGENWCPSTGQAGNSRALMDSAVDTIKLAGVKVPANYWSPM